MADGNTVCSGTTNTATGYTCSLSTLTQGTHSLTGTYVGTYNGGLQAHAGPIQVQVWPVVPTPTAQFSTQSLQQRANSFSVNSNANAVIRYTTDGSTPSCTYGTVYSYNNGYGEVIPGSGTVKAIACITNYIPSSILIDTY